MLAHAVLKEGAETTRWAVCRAVGGGVVFRLECGGTGGGGVGGATIKVVKRGGGGASHRHCSSSSSACLCHRLVRGQQRVSPGGIIHGFRVDTYHHPCRVESKF